MSWDPSIATIKCSGVICKAVWSPCSRFIAISLRQDSGGVIQILDAATLKQLKIFTTPHPSTASLAFSPERHLLTWAGSESGPLISWDLQTGVQVSETPMEELYAHYSKSITHSMCGTMFGILLIGSKTTAITTYDILSSTSIYHHSIKGSVIHQIWTHSECLQFVTLGPEFLTIWELGFTSKHPPTKVESLPSPSNYDPTKREQEYLFLPTPPRLAFSLKGTDINCTIFVWDAQHHKFLLNYVDAYLPTDPTFSSDGCFFACATINQGICLWRESSTGYILHQKLASDDMGFRKSLLSPSGQSIIDISDSILQLWHTMDSTTSPSSVASQVSKNNIHILEFSPDRSLAVAAQSKDNIATVIDLKSGATQLTIDAGVGICGLKITGSTIIAVGDGKIITWDLSAVGFALNARVSINESVQTTMFGPSFSLKSLWTTVFGQSALLKIEHIQSASISPSSDHMAVMGMISGRDTGLIIYSLSGEHLADTIFSEVWRLMWFSPDGHEVWCGQPGKYKGWRIIKDNESNSTKLEGLNPARGPSGGSPWESSGGYQITENGWILSSTGMQLFWLPPHWRSHRENMIWNGQFLSPLINPEPELIILELPEE